jgi:hypothetical protein
MQLKDLMPVAMILLVAVIALSIGSEILIGMAQEQCDTSFHWNTTQNKCVNASGTYTGGGTTYALNASMAGTEGLSTFGNWVPTIALVAAASIVIGVLVYSFMGSGRT